MRTTSAAMSGVVDGRPGRRLWEPSYFWATNLRYERRIVSGVKRPGRSATPRRPSMMPFRPGGAAVVGKAQASGSVRGAEDPVLLEQVVNDRLLVPVHPAPDKQEQESERVRWRVHGGSLSQRATRFKVRRLISCGQIRSPNFSPGRVSAQHWVADWLLRITEPLHGHVRDSAAVWCW
jgi:hypothetical protein